MVISRGLLPDGPICLLLSASPGLLIKLTQSRLKFPDTPYSLVLDSYRQTQPHCLFQARKDTGNLTPTLIFSSTDSSTTAPQISLIKTNRRVCACMNCGVVLSLYPHQAFA